MIVKRRRRGKFGFPLISLRLATTSGRQKSKFGVGGGASTPRFQGNSNFVEKKG